jgi:uncharacterized damage-inducible protein DinB
MAFNCLCRGEFTIFHIHNENSGKMSFGIELSAELERSGKGTRELLSRIPSAELGWKPHEKSMSLGRLGMHLAELPGWIISVLTSDELDFAKGEYKPIEPQNTAEILAKFDEMFPKAVKLLSEATAEQLAGTWSLRSGDNIFWTLPKSQVLRTQFGHQNHHRGQLTVYLRLKDVPLPGLFGPTADTMNFG